MPVRFLFALLLLVSHLHSVDVPKGERPLTELAAENQELAVLDNCIDLLSGRFFIHERSMVVGGPDPLDLTRVHNSASPHISEVGYGFGLNIPRRLSNFTRLDNGFYIEAETRVGSVMHLKAGDQKDQIDFKYSPYLYDLGLHNVHSGEMGARTNPRQFLFRYKDWGKKHKGGHWELTTGDGSVKHYGPQNSGWLLRSEDLPSGNHRLYKYDKQNRITRMETVSADGSTLINAIDLVYKPGVVEATGSDGQVVKYGLKEFKQVTNNRDYEIRGRFAKLVVGTRFPLTEYEWNKNPADATLHTFGRVILPGGRNKFVTYDNKNGKVKALYESCNQANERNLKYRIKYQADGARVENSLGATTTYLFDDSKRLSKIQGLETDEFFTWSDCKLASRTLKDKTGKLLRQVKFQYDPRGNVIKETLRGSLRKQGQLDSYVKQYSYSNDSLNVMTREFFPSGKSVRYEYRPGTNLLTEKITLDKAGNEVHRVTQRYDDCANLVETEVRTPCSRTRTSTKPCMDLVAFGKPEVVTESVWDGTEWKVLSQQRYIYNAQGLVASKIDEQGTEHFEYDFRGQCKRHTNAAGHTTEYGYDAVGNVLRETSVDSGRNVLTSYNKQNRPVRVSVTDGTYVLSSEAQTWSIAGLLESQTDRFGAVSVYTYDQLGRETRCTDPTGTVLREYDALGNCGSITDQDGYCTRHVYGARGQVLETTHPDGSKESWEYDLEGNVTLHTHTDGNVSRYTYDSLGNCLREESSGWITKREFRGAFLVEENDQGCVTKKSYDSAGRLSEEICHGRRITYHYDSEGRITEKRSYENDGNYIEDKTVYNALGEVTERSSSHSSGGLLSKEELEYNSFGNVDRRAIWITEDQVAVNKTAYNLLGEKVTVTDPLGRQTHYRVYSDNGRVDEEIDPLGRVTRVRHNLAGQPTAKESFSELEKRLACTEMSYDGRGHKSQQIERVYENDASTRCYVVKWTYDSKGRLKTLEEPDKVTRYEHDLAGRLLTTTKPDGVRLNRVYSGEGELLELKSSDDTVHVTYEYDSRRNPTRITTRDSDLILTREYSIHGEVVAERQGPHLQTYQYDCLGRLTNHVLPDGRAILYDYRGGRLRAVTFGGWTHLCEEYDLLGHLRCSSLPGAAGLLTRAFDISGRPTGISCDAYHVEDVDYNEVDLLIHARITDVNGNYSLEASYDQWDNLERELGVVDTHLTFDSLGNRIASGGLSYVIGPGNELLASGSVKFSYDANGNRLTDGKKTYTYDALDRLIGVRTPTQSVTYRYDGLGRRAYRNDQRFLWTGQCEIGSIKSGADLTSLRVLGGRKHLEVGSAVIVEINDRVYVPLHDLQGNCIALIKPETGTVVGNARYSACGEQVVVGGMGPWRFSSKRFDEVTGLHHFGGRDYDAVTGRWMTPDPMGFVDGSNLYAFVHNDPLRNIDPLGYWSIGNSGFCAGFNRGFLDDTSFGASELMLGRYNCDTWGKNSGYVIGTGASLAAGLFYGATEIKAVQKSLHTGGRITRCAASILSPRSPSYAAKTINQIDDLSKTSLDKSYLARMVRSIEATAAANLKIVSRSMEWPSPGDGRQIRNGIEYTVHALERMAPHGLVQVGNKIYSRGIPPIVVENAIRYGKKLPGRTSNEVVHAFDDIRVVTNHESTRVITVYERTSP